jgi:hypothetical protein
MKFHDAAMFRQVLEQRLEDRANGDRAHIVHDRRSVVFDRLLARLVAAAPGQWALTGGFAFDLRLGTHTKTTWELKLEWRPDRVMEFREIMFEVGEHDVGDLFEFEIGLAGQAVMGGTVSSRFEAGAFLAGSPFETVSVGLTFRLGEMPTETLRTEDLLGFAGIDRVEVEAVPLEVQVAEKIYRYVSAYREVVESRGARDLLDLSMIAERTSLNPVLLRAVTNEVFESHKAEPPEALQRPPAEWAEPFSGLAEDAGAQQELVAGYSAAASLLDPVLRGETSAGIWSAARQEWIDPFANGHSPSG